MANFSQRRGRLGNHTKGRPHLIGNPGNRSAKRGNHEKLSPEGSANLTIRIGKTDAIKLRRLAGYLHATAGSLVREALNDLFEDYFVDGGDIPAEVPL